ncbi:MAG: NAD(P)H-binding protein [Rhizobacter sp.]|nr:NAD(P)H-binding protein [Rhizobacter sp.]
MPSTVLILGAAGHIGQALSMAFADAGWRVLAQARKPLPDRISARPGIHALRCDALDGAALASAAREADVVIHALNPPYTEWDRLALPLMDAAIAAAQVNHALLMLPGNVYNFGRELPPVLTPATPERGDTPKARIRIEAEARMAAATGIDSVVIRAGDFFGGGQGGTWFDLALASKIGAGRFVYPGPTDVEHAWAYLPDLARSFVKVADQRAQLQGHHRFHFAGHAASGDDMRSALEAVADRALRVAGLPWWLMRLGAPFVPMWRELLAMRYLWQRPHRLEDAALRELIGSVPNTALPQAVAEALVDGGLLAKATQPVPA